MGDHGPLQAFVRTLAMAPNEADLVSCHSHPARLRTAPTPNEALRTEATRLNAIAWAAARSAAATEALPGYIEVLSLHFQKIPNQAV
jgi:hypothetical protein